ncbi:MAG TPA: hypothetical protein VG826_20205 [Pirellulales bacterium]|nr:hypothetical protein [Pirellulales bacterium]
MTVFAVWLGWKVEGARRYREAIRAIEAVGGGYVARLDRSKAFLATAKRLGYDEKTFYDVRGLGFGQNEYGYDPKEPVGDETLGSLAEHIALFTNMETLELSDPAITNRGIAALPPLPNVTTIYLRGTGVSDGLDHALQRFPGLTKLVLTGTGVTAAGIDEIRRRFPDCTIER